jgi:hypothetical protein
LANNTFTLSACRTPEKEKSEKREKTTTATYGERSANNGPLELLGPPGAFLGNILLNALLVLTPEEIFICKINRLIRCRFLHVS